VCSSWQPNYAFNNVSAAQRFEDIRQLAFNYSLGVEIEIPDGVRNAMAGGWRGNFDTYLAQVSSWKGAILRSYYYGNVFVTDYAANHSNFDYYTRLWRFVKGMPDERRKMSHARHPLVQPLAAPVLNNHGSNEFPFGQANNNKNNRAIAAREDATIDGRLNLLPPRVRARLEMR
jgi:hypothetical protein